MIRHMLVNRLQYVLRGQTGDDLGRTVKPAHRSLAIHEDGRRRIDVAAVPSGVGMEEFRGPRQALALVREHEEVRKLGLRLLGVVGPFHRNHDHARIAAGEVLVVTLELTQLDHAVGSPTSAEKDHCAILRS